jgi:CMP-N,N'-diacetyllegionaminic acid synthase
MILGVIPARGGSVGLPRKNILPFCGKPLIHWSIKAALESVIDTVIVSSEDDEILAVAGACGIRRPAELATCEASAVDVMLHALDVTPGYDWCVLLQPTSPLRTAADIDACIALARGSHSCVSITLATESPYWMYGMDNGELKPLMGNRVKRRQDLPRAWLLNGAVYVARVDWFREHKTFVGAGTLGYEMPAKRSIDIDDLADFQAAEKEKHDSINASRARYEARLSRSRSDRGREEWVAAGYL